MHGAGPARDLGEGGVDGRFVGDVGGDPIAPAAGGRDALQRLLRLASAEDGHLRAGLREPDRGGLSNPLARPGHDRDLAFQSKPVSYTHLTLPTT